MLEAKHNLSNWFADLPDFVKITTREYAQILNQATLQSRYSGGRKVEWHFSNPRVADFWASEFRLKGLDNIRVFYTPFDENFIPHLEKYCFFAFT